MAERGTSRRAEHLASVAPPPPDPVVQVDADKVVQTVGRGDERLGCTG